MTRPSEVRLEVFADPEVLAQPELRTKSLKGQVRGRIVIDVSA